MYAIIAAGGTPTPEDPLYVYTQGEPKALLEIGGKPMIQWVVDALSGAQSIDGIILIGLDRNHGITSHKPLHFQPNQAGMLENILAGIEAVQRINPGPQYILAASSDIPAIQPEMVDWVVKAATETENDLYYNVVTRQSMEARYPQSKRTYLHLKDMQVCGGDLHVLHTRAAESDKDFWRQVIAARKNPLKQAGMIGFDVLFLLLCRQIKLQDAVRKVGMRVHLKGRAVVCPYAEIGMDVDKPHQLEMMRQELRQSPKQAVEPHSAASA